MQRIRPAVAALTEGIGLDYALASNRLMSDGAEVLWSSNDPADHRLVVVRNGQAVFSEVVEDYLRFIDFGGNGWAESIRLPRFENAVVRVSPQIRIVRARNPRSAAPAWQSQLSNLTHPTPSSV